MVNSRIIISKIIADEIIEYRNAAPTFAAAMKSLMDYFHDNRPPAQVSARSGKLPGILFYEAIMASGT